VTTIHTEAALKKFFAPLGDGRIPAFHRGALTREERRELVEALIDYYINHRDARENAQ
jgi:hypothetical protein